MTAIYTQQEIRDSTPYSESPVQVLQELNCVSVAKSGFPKGNWCLKCSLPFNICPPYDQYNVVSFSILWRDRMDVPSQCTIVRTIG